MCALEKKTQFLLDYPYAVLNDTAISALIDLDFVRFAEKDDIQGHFLDLSVSSSLKIKPKGTALIFTEQHFDMPPYITGQISLRSFYARMFLDQINSVQIKAGWRGFLLLELVNHGDKTVKIKAGDKVAQVFFTKVPKCEQAYSGKYQDQKNEAEK